MESIESASSAVVEDLHARKILQELWRQCESEEFCDVVLIAGTEEKRIPAHSNILSAASKYFKGMLSPRISKSTANEVKISNVDGVVLQSFVKYCYTGRIAFTEDIVVKLLENAYEPVLSDLLSVCENLFVERLLPSNCLGYKLLGQKYGCEKLLEKARDYSLEHFLEVQEMDEFLRLNADQLGELLGYDNLNVTSEESVFNSLLKWLRHDPIEREKYQAELMKLVRLQLLKKSFLKEHVRPICTSAECREIYFEAIEKSFFNENSIARSSATPKKSVKPEKSVKLSKSKQFLMGISTDVFSKIHIYYHCPEQHKFMKCSKILHIPFEYSHAIMEDNLFIVGGSTCTYEPLNTVVRLNLKMMNLIEICPMREKRMGCGVAVLNGFLYAVGGRVNAFDVIKSVEKWNPKTNTWSIVASMEVHRCGFGIAVLNEKLYAVGGKSWVKEVVSSAECYDSHKDVWIPIAPMHEKHYNFGLVVYKGQLYAVGGSDGEGYSKTVERYNPETNCWTMLCQLNDNVNRSLLCTTFRDELIVWYKDRVEEYDEETNEWKESTTLKVLKNIHSIFTYSGELLTTEFVEN